MALSPYLQSIFLDFEFKPVYPPKIRTLHPPTVSTYGCTDYKPCQFQERDLKTVNKLGARGSEDGKETGSVDGKQTRGSQGSRGARGSEDLEESRRAEDGEETGFEGGKQTRGSQGSGGARGSEDFEETRGSQDGEGNGSDDGEQTRGSQGSGGAREPEDVEETRGSQDGEATGSADGGKARESDNGEETGPRGSENGPEARGSKVNTRSELMNCIKKAISLKANCQVHAEVKVLGYLQRHGLIGKAINSARISRLCCPACLGYISVMDIAIRVGGTHNNWYLWHLCPVDELLPLDQLRSMKEIMLEISSLIV